MHTRHMTTTQRTAGQNLTATLRTYFHVSARTRRVRKGQNLQNEMLDMLLTANQYPGYYSEAQHEALRGSFALWASWQKHVEGYRIDGMLRYRLTTMSPWEFSALLGDMLDAGVTNVGQAEEYFARMSRQAVAA
jgi:hypothetical protein